MLNNFREYLKLIRDTRTFLQNKQAFHLKNDRREPSHTCAPPRKNLKDGVADLTLITPNSEKETSERETASKPKGHSKKEINEKKNAWELQPMPTIERQNSFLNKLSSFTKTCHLHIPTVLVLPEENVEHRFFLENVCRAITRTFMPATVTLYSDKILKDGQANFLFIPIDLLNKKFPNARPYEVFKIDPTDSNTPPNTCQKDWITVMPIETIEKYLHDTSCKRVLWNAIQHLFRS